MYVYIYANHVVFQLSKSLFIRFVPAIFVSVLACFTLSSPIQLLATCRETPNFIADRTSMILPQCC